MPNRILRNSPFCSFALFLIASLTPSYNSPEFSRDLTIFKISSISTIYMINVVLWPGPKIFLCIPASAADAAVVNPNESKTFIMNDLAGFFKNGKQF